MIETILFEKDLAPSTLPVECFTLPGIRRIQFNRPLKYRYDDFGPKLLYFMKRLGYKKYLQKFFFTMQVSSTKVQSRYYELPLFLAALTASGLIKLKDPFCCNGIIDQNTGLVSNIEHYLEIGQEIGVKKLLHIKKPIPLQILITELSKFIVAIEHKPIAYEHIHSLIFGEYERELITQSNWLKEVFPESKKTQFFTKDLAKTYLSLDSNSYKKLRFIFQITTNYDAALWNYAQKFMKNGAVFQFIVPDKFATGSTAYRNSTEKTLHSLKNILDQFTFRYYIALNGKKETKQIDREQCEKILTL